MDKYRASTDREPTWGIFGDAEDKILNTSPRKLFTFDKQLIFLGNGKRKSPTYIHFIKNMVGVTLEPTMLCTKKFSQGLLFGKWKPLNNRVASLVFFH